MKTQNEKRLFAWLPLCGLALAGLISCSHSPVNFQKQLQEQLIKAKAGDVIEVPEGKFQLDRTLSLSADKVTIRGKGMDKSILSFAGQKEGGSGMLVKANDFMIEDLAIEDTAGDGLTVQGGNNVTIRRVRVEWTRGANAANGPYAIYPTECKNVLVEDSIAKGAVDTGFYIGYAPSQPQVRLAPRLHSTASSLITVVMHKPGKVVIASCHLPGDCSLG